MPQNETKMEKRTISFPAAQLEQMELIVKAGVFPSLSELSRQAHREYLERHPVPAGGAA